MDQLSLSGPLASGPLALAGHRRPAPAPRIVRLDLLIMLADALRASDIACAAICGLVAYWLRWRSYELGFNYGMLIVLSMLVVANVMGFLRVYDLGHLGTFRFQLTKVVCGWGVTIAILLVIAFFGKITDGYSRIWIATWLALGATVSILARLAAATYFDHRRRAGNLSVSVAVVGDEVFARRVIHQITRPGGIDIKIVGVFAPELGCNTQDRGIDALLRLAQKTRVDEIIVDLPKQRNVAYGRMLRKLAELPVNVHLCGDLSDLPVSPRQFTVLQQTFMINVVERPLAGWAAVIKRAEDIVLSAILLVLFGPLMAILAVLVRLDSPGPALFRQPRHGFNNNPITVYKFRTMTVDASRDPSAQQARRNDPRVTRLGRWLRRTSLDELPQLINVFKGDMSLVGPRPHPVPLNERFANVIDGYLSRHRVKPGITGWAQVNGWRGETAHDEAMIQRVRYDLDYIDNWTLWLDLWILLRTALGGFMHANAY